MNDIVRGLYYMMISRIQSAIHVCIHQSTHLVNYLSASERYMTLVRQLYIVYVFLLCYHSVWHWHFVIV